MLWATLFGLYIIFFPGSLSAHKTTWDDTQIKAAFVYNLTYFIFWDQKDLGDLSQPFHILALGNDDMGDILKKITSHEAVMGHSITVENTPLRPLHEYPIIFVSDNMTSRTRQLQTELHGCHTLLIGENMQFLEQGGMISFICIKKKVKIYYNQRALHAADIHVSAKLYQIAIPLQDAGEFPQ
ncbi:MAG: YfiR family protein [Desulfoplanes sp.]|nr:YfiR family protein [Desulfoplanes sp.]MDD4648935.1 YfiR family protein [Desulfoplanes sp.]